MTDQSCESNSYGPPSQADDKADSSRSGESNEINDLSPDCRGNLTLTSKIIRFASVVFGIGSVASIIQVWSAFRLYGFPDGWTWWHTLIVYRVVYAPCWLLLAWMLWRYAKSLDQMAIRGAVEIENAMEQQAKMWLAVGLLLFVMLIGLAITFSGALSTQIPR
jgi:uncharacterized membrane protein